MERLRRIANDVDAPPGLVTETARAAFSTRRLDANLAELLEDSDMTSSATVRLAQPGPRLLSFAAGDVSLELQLEQVRGRVVLRGVVTGVVDDAEIETITGQVQRAEIDDQGWFGVEALPVQPFRVRVRAVDGPAITTGWIRP